MYARIFLPSFSSSIELGVITFSSLTFIKAIIIDIDIYIYIYIYIINI